MKTKQLLLTLLTFLLPLASWADVWQDPETKVNYEFTVGQNEAKVSSSRNLSGDIAILSKFTVDGNEYTVTSIGEWAFMSCTSMTNITIPSSITIIGNYAFQYCRGITVIDIPSSVNSIGQYAFQNCSALTTVTIPSSVTEHSTIVLK